jgi:hypothetical protein
VVANGKKIVTSEVFTWNFPVPCEVAIRIFFQLQARFQLSCSEVAAKISPVASEVATEFQ